MKLFKKHDYHEKCLLTSQDCAREYLRLYLASGWVEDGNGQFYLDQGFKIFSDMSRFGYEAELSLYDFSELNIKPLIPEKARHYINQVIYCRCGSAMCNDTDHTTECLNKTCDLYGVKFKLPEIELEKL